MTLTGITRYERYDHKTLKRIWRVDFEFAGQKVILACDSEFSAEQMAVALRKMADDMYALGKS